MIQPDSTWFNWNRLASFSCLAFYISTTAFQSHEIFAVHRQGQSALHIAATAGASNSADTLGHQDDHAMKDREGICVSLFARWCPFEITCTFSKKASFLKKDSFAPFIVPVTSCDILWHPYQYLSISFSKGVRFENCRHGPLILRFAALSRGGSWYNCQGHRAISARY